MVQYGILQSSKKTSTKRKYHTQTNDSRNVMEETIKAFLVEQLLIDFAHEIDRDSDLFQLGLLDSYTYVELLRFIESRFAIKFSDEEILSNVMVSLSGIVALVAEKMAEPA